MINACRHGEIDKVKLLLAIGVSPAAGWCDENALLVSIKRGDISLVQLLLDRGARVSGPNGSRNRPIQLAYEESKYDIVDLLLTHGAEPLPPEQLLEAVFRSRDEGGIKKAIGQTPSIDLTGHLIAAIRSGDETIIDILVEQGKGRFTLSPLMVEAAAALGSLQFLRNLFGKLDGLTNLSGVALFYALSGKNEKAAGLLVFYANLLGIEKELANTGVSDALAVTLAIENGWFSLAKEMIEMKFPLDFLAGKTFGASSKKTPLMAAVSAHQHDLVARLLDQGAVVDACDGDNFSALGYAVIGNDVRSVELLLSKGADPNLKFGGRSSGTPFTKAVYTTRNKRIVEMLLDHHADPSTTETGGEHREPALVFALVKGLLDLAEVLIRKGADVNCKSLHGSTPLHIARHHGYAGIVKLLEDRNAAVNGFVSKRGDQALNS